MIRQFEMPFRKTYEFYAAIGWAVALASMLVASLFADLPPGPFWYMAAVAVFFLVLNTKSSWHIWSIKLSLSGVGIDFMPIERLKKIVAKTPTKVWLGFGFDWKPEHTQRIYELKKVDPANFYPPEAFLHVKQYFSDKKVASLNKENIGAPWIHGVEPDEKEIHMSLDNLIGNTLIVGTTRCGKTRLIDVLMAQFIFRECASLIIIDPKGDIELQENMRRAAKAAGRENDFSSFHLGFPGKSIRIDPMKNYNNVSELASRVASLVPSDSGAGDAFTAFAWDVSNAILMGLVEVGDKPTILKLKRYVESGVGDLLANCILAFFNKNVAFLPDWEKKTKEYISRAIKRMPDGSMPARDATTKEVLAGLQMMYESLYKAKGVHSEAVEALANTHKHDVTHYGKMLANFKPVLAMLTTGEIGELLSPDATNIDDERLSTDMMSLTDSRGLVYIGLNALADKTVASAVGAMLLSDLAAVAAARYNFRDEALNKQNPVYVIVDEAAQVVNDPYIQILNMGGGAGFVNIAATQTVPDFTARLGNEDKARQMLGNFNNLFALRSKDRTTQDFITETFGESYVYSMQTTKGTNSSTEKNIAHFGGTISERVSETLEEKFPTELLGMMPNWQYIASVSGGRLIKGRVPILSAD